MKYHPCIVTVSAKTKITAILLRRQATALQGNKYDMEHLRIIRIF